MKEIFIDDDALIAPKTDEETMRALCRDDVLNRVRNVFSMMSGRIDQELRQRRRPTPVEIRRM